MKSPHVGNVYPCNLAVAKLGIPMVFYDRTIGEKDQNFHPHGVIRGGRFERLSAVHILTTHTKSHEASSLAPEWFSVGASMKDGHMRALRAAIPTLEGDAYTDILLDRAQEFLPILEASFQAMPALWNRYVCVEGMVHEVWVSSWSSLLHREIFGVTNKHKGVLIPNTLNILALSILEAKEKKLTDIYHLSGPDMVRYIKSLYGELHRLYDAVRIAIPDWHLPEILTFHVVPVADMRFATVNTRRHALDQLMDESERQMECKRMYGERIRAASQRDQHTVKTELTELRKKDQDRFICAVKNCPDVFYNIYHQNAPSQYDVLDAGGLYVHPWAIQAPMHEISTFMRQCERAMKLVL